MTLSPRASELPVDESESAEIEGVLVLAEALAATERRREALIGIRIDLSDDSGTHSIQFVLIVNLIQMKWMKVMNDESDLQ
jgi:hypothetical protein